MYLCTVKRKLIQIGSLLMALYVLFVTLDLNVHFHYCSQDHHLTSSFGDASEHCVHCVGHHHHETEKGSEAAQDLHFEARCCCEDFASEIAFSDAFVFSKEKPQVAFLPVIMMAETFRVMLDDDLSRVGYRFFREKTPYFLTGRLRMIFLSHLKLNPLVY